jgi:general stress protein 26
MAETGSPVAKLNELIKSIEFAMLTTIRADGTLHSCPMATQKVQADGIAWFFTENRSEKVEAIKTEPRLNLAYSDSGTQRYVSISGVGELVRNHALARQLWEPRYETWFPKGLDDPDMILLGVHVRQVEYWSAAEGHMAQLTGFAPQP